MATANFEVITKSQKFADFLRNELLNGNYKENDKFPSITVLSKEFSINRTTVDKVVSILVAEGLLYRIQGRGTFASNKEIETKDMKKKSSHIIDVVFPSAQAFAEDYNPLSHFILSNLLRGITDAAEMNSIEVKMKFIPNRKHEETNYFWENKTFDSTREGIILIERPEWMFENLSKKHIPYTVANLVVINPEFNYVIADQQTGAYEATKHMIMLGNRKIAFLGNTTPSSKQVFGRFLGYKRALLDNGIKPDKKVIKQCTSYEEALKCMKDILRLKEIPTAVFAHNDIRAIGAMKAIREAGLDIPDDIAVIGFDDIDEAKEQNPPLTTVRHPFYEIGLESVLLLLKILRNEVKTPAKRVLKTPLIIRKSSEKRRGKSFR